MTKSNERLSRQDKSFGAKTERSTSISNGDEKEHKLKKDINDETKERAIKKSEKQNTDLISQAMTSAWSHISGANSVGAKLSSETKSEAMSSSASKLKSTIAQHDSQSQSKHLTSFVSLLSESLHQTMTESSSEKSAFETSLYSTEPSRSAAGNESQSEVRPQQHQIEETKTKKKKDESNTMMATIISESTPTSKPKTSSDIVLEDTKFFIRPSIDEKLLLNCTCMLCCSTFENPFELQSHLVLLTHLPRERLKLRENFLYPEFDCTECKTRKCNKEHKCAKKMGEFLHEFASIHTRSGSPLTCTLCEGKRFKSIHHLTLHVVIYHGFRNLSTREKHLHCPFCHAVFKTKHSYVIEAHASDVHLPEMMVKKQKLMHPENKAHELTSRHFSCHFENRRYRYAPFVKETSLQNCAAIYFDLAGLIGHLCYAHFPVPEDFHSTKARPIICNACLFQFANRTELSDHVHAVHISYLRLRSLLVHYNDSFEDHCDPTMVCQFCWTDQDSVQRLQTHILVYHVDSWRKCGFCKREFCESHESVSPKIIYLMMEHHVEHHVKHLEEHYNEMSKICQFRQPPYDSYAQPASANANEGFFKKVEVYEHRHVSSDNATKNFFPKLKEIIRMKSSCQ